MFRAFDVPRNVQKLSCKWHNMLDFPLQTEAYKEIPTMQYALT